MFEERRILETGIYIRCLKSNSHHSRHFHPLRCESTKRISQSKSPRVTIGDCEYKTKLGPPTEIQANEYAVILKNKIEPEINYTQAVWSQSSRDPPRPVHTLLHSPVFPKDVLLTPAMVTPLPFP